VPYGRTRGDLGSQVDFVRLKKETREKTKAAMAKYGLDAVLCMRQENCRYLTIGPAYPVYRYVFFPGHAEEPTHFEAGMIEPAYRDIPGQKVKVAIPVPEALLLNSPAAFDVQLAKLVAQLKQELAEAGLLKGRIGIDTDSGRLIGALEAEGIKVTLDGWRAMTDARLRKTRDEIELMRISCAIIEAGFQRAREVIRPGITEQQVYAEMAKRCLEQGAELVAGGHVSSGPHSFPIANTRTDRIIRPGDIVLIDLYDLQYWGYKTCYYRNFVVGKPTQAQKDAWARARDYTWNAIRMMKPGVTTGQVAALWPRAEEFGYADEEGACLCQWAHGMGLTGYEPPLISRIWSIDHPEVLEEGMVMAMETISPTGEITPDHPTGQALRIEEEIYITKNGCELLSVWPVDEIIECW